MIEEVRYRLFKRASPAKDALGLTVLVLVIGISIFSVLRAMDSSRSSTNTGALVLPPGSSLRAGSHAPLSLIVPSLVANKTIDIKAMARGRAVVVNFFASWCPECTAELASFAKLARTENKRVLFVGIDTNDPNQSAALRALRAAGVSYPVGVDLNSDKITSAWGLSNGLPVTFFLRPNGRIALEVLGEQSTPVLEKRVNELTKGQLLS